MLASYKSLHRDFCQCAINFSGVHITFVIYMKSCGFLMSKKDAHKVNNIAMLRCTAEGLGHETQRREDVGKNTDEIFWGKKLIHE